MQSLDGQCFCNEVQFTISQPESTPPTHNLPTLTAVIGPEQLQLVKGKKVLHTLSWGDGASWQECGRCRTRLFYCQSAGNEVYVQLGAIRDRFRRRNLKLPDWLPVGPEPGKLVRRLHRAAKSGQFHKVRRLLARGVPVDAEVQGETALEGASHLGRLRICRLLLSQGADVCRALRHAWDRLRMDRLKPMFRLLLEYGYPAQDLLLRAIDSGSVGTLALLLKQSLDLNQQDDQGRTLLERASGSSKMIRLLIRHGVDVSLVGRAGTHALATCAYFGQTRSLKTLLESGFPPDLPEHQAAGPALRYACSRGHVEAARLLLQFGANPNLADQRETPLMLACEHGSLVIAAMLLAAGADPHARDRRARPALHRAQMALPDLLRFALNRAERWPGEGPARHRWSKNSAGEIRLKVWKDGRSRHWTDGHAAIVHRLEPSAPLPPLLIRSNPRPREGSFPLDGGCDCGGLRFRIHASPQPELVTAILSQPRLVGVRDTRLEILSGPDSVYILCPDEDSSSWWRCKKCTHRSEVIFQTPEAPGCAYVRLKSLDDPEGARGLHLSSPEELYLTAKLKPHQQVLHWAAQAGDTRRVARLIARGWPVDVEVDGWTPLKMASNSGCLRTARLLLRHGANARKAILLDGHSALDYLPAWLNTLTDHGCDPQKMLGRVTEAGTPAALRVLLRAGADLNRPDKEGIHPLLLASHNSCNMIRFVLASGADPSIQSGGLHALGFCAAFGFAGRARALLQSGFPVNLREERGPRSALCYACESGHVRTARVLLEAGADANLGWGQVTPLMCAARRGSLLLVNLLLEFGADPTLRDDGGRTALDYAELRGNAVSPDKRQSLRDRLSNLT